MGYLKTPAAGVIRQMEEEQKAADELNIPWVTRLYCPKGTHGQVCISPNHSKSGSLILKREYYKWLSKQTEKYDAIVLRYASNDPYQGWFMRRSPVPVVTVHHALEVTELSTGNGIKSRIKSALERYTGPWAIAQAAAIAGVTWEIARYEAARSLSDNQPIFRYSNGAYYEAGAVVPRVPNREIPELLFIASRFAPWIGLDRVLLAAAETDRSFIIHLVGEVPDELARQVSEDSRFVIHGLQSFEYIRKLMTQCTLGLASFGLDRNHMREGCTLKVREYLKAGLPVYASYVDSFPEEFKYYQCGPVIMESILEFADKMSGAMSREVSEASRPHIDKKELLKEFYSEIECLLEKVQ